MVRFIFFEREEGGNAKNAEKAGRYFQKRKTYAWAQA
jgi:hypothetical protein